jgi:hypothetical protein
VQEWLALDTLHGAEGYLEASYRPRLCILTLRAGEELADHEEFAGAARR